MERTYFTSQGRERDGGKEGKGGAVAEGKKTKYWVYVFMGDSSAKCVSVFLGIRGRARRRQRLGGREG